MKTTKRAELSITMIVMIALSLIILVIFVFLIASRGKGLDESTKCTSLGGVCTSSANCPLDDQLGGQEFCKNSVDTSKVCCNPLGVISK